MTNHVPFECGTLDQVFTLSIALDQGYSKQTNASMTSERFLKSAVMLPEGEFIGWQINFDKWNSYSGHVFTSPDAKVTTEDLNWIFWKCAVVRKKPWAVLDDLHEVTRKVYILSTIPGMSEYNVSTGNKDDYLYDDLNDICCSSTIWSGEIGVFAREL